MVPVPCPILCVRSILFFTTTFPVSHSLDGVNIREHSVASACATGFVSRYVLNDDIVKPYVRGDHTLDNIPLFALDCNDISSHMCAVGTELETPKFVHRSGWEIFVRACGFH